MILEEVGIQAAVIGLSLFGANKSDDLLEMRGFNK